TQHRARERPGLMTSSRPTAFRDKSNYGKDRDDKTAIHHARPQRDSDPLRHYPGLFPRLGIRLRPMDRAVSDQQPQPYFHLFAKRFRLGRLAAAHLGDFFGGRDRLSD